MQATLCCLCIDLRTSASHPCIRITTGAWGRQAAQRVYHRGSKSILTVECQPTADSSTHSICPCAHPVVFPSVCLPSCPSAPLLTCLPSCVPLHTPLCHFLFPPVCRLPACPPAYAPTVHHRARPLIWAQKCARSASAHPTTLCSSLTAAPCKSNVFAKATSLH